ncbi:hypothetical protein [Peribacillus alkalitolerans]|uniref:hypothetical protein n=1 Tax=Peribacillus alkalitolerans TaxID=1550385 RepID=UPI0013D3E9C0|nr:hypothetical protein [Peribacillus alkalitolerans]
MKKFILVILFLTFLVSPSQIKAFSMPCTMTLEPINKDLRNAKGSALIYKVQLNPPSFARTNVSILAVHLPEPSSYGEYDSYEGFSFIPNVISWRFKLFPSKENPPTWAGRFDLITAEMDNAEVQVRLSNSKTQRLGPSILTNMVSSCM